MTSGQITAKKNGIGGPIKSFKPTSPDRGIDKLNKSRPPRQTHLFSSVTVLKFNGSLGPRRGRTELKIPAHDDPMPCQYGPDFWSLKGVLLAPYILCPRSCIRTFTVMDVKKTSSKYYSFNSSNRLALLFMPPSETIELLTDSVSPFSTTDVFLLSCGITELESGQFETVNYKLIEEKIKLPDAVLAFMLLIAYNLDRNQKHLVLSGVKEKNDVTDFSNPDQDENPIIFPRMKNNPVNEQGEVKRCNISKNEIHWGRNSKKRRPWKRGGNRRRRKNEDKVKMKIKLPCQIGATHAYITTDVIDKDITLLWSKESMRKAEMVLNFTNDILFFRGKKIMLGNSPSGHYTIGISNSNK
ncbi:unnamed protein product [Lepeophtheirus salmonis]|uniref:(salmon louse) hypothetical protein n=1 Tax=Lepeophtheirus salmonis TaxID=72036 RepID=A0A7R8CQT0_LEPSM|nr:unnamed protein product [Lepeophtheirus salmonis]CAF2864617.1 unnamed protein product [Lepeophtheirus salmonis]